MAALLAWLYANTAGNLVASFIAFCVAGVVHHIGVVKPLHRRLDAQDAQLAAIDQQTGGDGDAGR